MLLTCEYALRTDQHSLVFLLCGLLYRALRLLGLDSKQPSIIKDDTTAALILAQEVETRIVWSCYIIDALVSSGVDQNSSWRGDVPQVPLPCSDQEFLAQSPPSVTRFLPLVDEPDMLILQHLDLQALVSIMAGLRMNVLRCVCVCLSQLLV